MDIDLHKVAILPINFQNVVTIPKEYYAKMDLDFVSPIDLSFTIFKDLNQDDILRFQAKGYLLLKDARTNEPVKYPLNIQFEEKITEDSEICGQFVEKSKNTLDILAILWENIVLEIPISYTVAEELEIQGNGYQVSGKKSGESIDPRLAPLLELLDKEKE